MSENVDEGLKGTEESELANYVVCFAWRYEMMQRREHVRSDAFKAPEFVDKSQAHGGHYSLDGTADSAAFVNKKCYRELQRMKASLEMQYNHDFLLYGFMIQITAAKEVAHLSQSYRWEHFMDAISDEKWISVAKNVAANFKDPNLLGPDDVGVEICYNGAK